VSVACELSGFGFKQPSSFLVLGRKGKIVEAVEKWESRVVGEISKGRWEVWETWVWFSTPSRDGIEQHDAFSNYFVPQWYPAQSSGLSPSMKSANLLDGPSKLHSSIRFNSNARPPRHEVRAVLMSPTPAGTTTHKPIPYHEVIQALIETLGYRKIAPVKKR
jgi:hypothetical protein